MKPFYKLFCILFIFLLAACGAPMEKRTLGSADQGTNESAREEVHPTESKDVDRQPASVISDKSLDFGDEELALDADDWVEEEVFLEPVPVMEPESGPSGGKLAFYCPAQMTYKKTSDVIGFIADLIDESVIKQMMKSRIEEQLDEDIDLDDDDLLIQELMLYNHIELRLDDSDNEGFTIKKIHENDVQQVEKNMEGWHWKVTPTTTDAQQQLILKVIVFNDEGSRVTSFDKTYRINVKIESKLFLRNTYALFVENPEWAFASIITPVFTFLFGRYNRRRKEKEKEKEKKKELK